MPKGLKSCFFTKFIRKLMDTIETAKETTIPTASKRSSKGVAVKPSRMNFSTLTPDAPAIIGIAIKKENSDAAERDTPVSIPPRMVEPERDVPGISERT